MALPADLAASVLRLRGPQRASRWPDHLLATIAMVLAAIALGWGLAALPPECDLESWFPDWPCLFPYALIGGAIYGLAFLPIALLALWSLRGANYGGWLPAIALGAGLGTIGGHAFLGADAPTSILAATGATLGSLYWSALFVLCRRRA